MGLAADLGIIILRLKFAYLLGVDDPVIKRALDTPYLGTMQHVRETFYLGTVDASDP